MGTAIGLFMLLNALIVGRSADMAYQEQAKEEMQQMEQAVKPDQVQSEWIKWEPANK